LESQNFINKNTKCPAIWFNCIICWNFWFFCCCKYFWSKVCRRSNLWGLEHWHYALFVKTWWG